MAVDALELVLADSLRSDAKRADPLKHEFFSSPQIRDMVRAIAREIEVNVVSGNSAGKTRGGARVGVALARGLRRCDGRTIREWQDGAEAFDLEYPRLRVPNVGLLIVSSYKQASESSVAAYLNLIGNHPHKVIRSGPWISEIRIKPDMVDSDDPDDWSRILIFPSDGALPEGIRADWAHADETPAEPFWREVRARVRAGQPMYRWITHTPIRPSLWRWLRAEYAIAADWKAEIRLHVRDNQALTPRDLRRLEDMFATDPLRDARLSGAYVNLEHTNPLVNVMELIEQGLDNSREPIRIEEAVVEAKDQEGYSVPNTGVVYIWEDAVAGESYYLPCDVSLGIDDRHHDPCGIHSYTDGKIGRVRMVARFNGYLGSYGTGSLAALMGERYNDGLLSPDMTGGYGQPFLIGTASYRTARHPAGYGMIEREMKIDDGEMKWKQPLGHVLTASAGKSEYAEYIRWGLLRGVVDVPSGATWRCLMDAVMDDRQRLVKPPGVHYEDWDLLGRRLKTLFMEQGDAGGEWDQKSERQRGMEALGWKPPRRQQGTGLSSYPWALSA